MIADRLDGIDVCRGVLREDGTVGCIGVKVKAPPDVVSDFEEAFEIFGRKSGKTSGRIVTNAPTLEALIEAVYADQKRLREDAATG